MKNPKYDPERVRDALKEAYFGKPSVEIGEYWQARLMSRIRETGPLVPESRFLPMFERVVWRLVPVTTPLALVMIALLIRMYLSSSPDAFQLFLQGVEELTMAQIFLG